MPRRGLTSLSDRNTSEPLCLLGRSPPRYLILVADIRPISITNRSSTAIAKPARVLFGFDLERGLSPSAFGADATEAPLSSLSAVWHRRVRRRADGGIIRAFVIHQRTRNTHTNRRAKK